MIFLLTADLTPLKFFHNRTLPHGIRWGTPIFARGGMILEQTLPKHVCGLYTYNKARVSKRTANLRSAQLKNKWAIATQKQFTTHQACGKNRKPVTVGPGTTITLELGYKIRLQSHTRGLGTPHKSFLTSSLSNFQKQFNRSTIMAFTLLMLLILPTILSLKISMTQFLLQSLIYSQIQCTVSL